MNLLHVLLLISHGQHFLVSMLHYMSDSLVFFSPLRSSRKPSPVCKANNLHIFLDCWSLFLIFLHAGWVSVWILVVTRILNDYCWGIWHHALVLASSDETQHQLKLYRVVLFVLGEVGEGTLKKPFDFLPPNVGVAWLCRGVVFIHQTKRSDYFTADRVRALAFEAALVPHLWSNREQVLVKEFDEGRVVKCTNVRFDTIKNDLSISLTLVFEGLAWNLFNSLIKYFGRYLFNSHKLLYNFENHEFDLRTGQYKEVEKCCQVIWRGELSQEIYVILTCAWLLVFGILSRMFCLRWKNIREDFNNFH